MLTASTAAKAIGECKYGTENDIILDKLGYSKYYNNLHMHHGNKYEEIATKVYEKIFDIQVKEYGLIPHQPEPKISFIGASPDGITCQFSTNNEFSDKVGRM